MPVESRYEGTIRRLAAELEQAGKKATKSRTRSVGEPVVPKKTTAAEYWESLGFDPKTLRT